jgi:hypothetical protein
MRDRVVVGAAGIPLAAEDSETVRRMASQDRATTVEEDIHLVESVQRGPELARLRSGAAGGRPGLRREFGAFDHASATLDAGGDRWVARKAFSGCPAR